MYRGIDGLEYNKSETSRHHIFARSLTNGTKQKKFINQEILVPRLLNEYHYDNSPNGLHRHVELLAPPPLFVIHCLQEAINKIRAERYDRLIEFAENVEHMSLRHGNSVVRKDCGRISDNLQRQLPFILEGQVECT